MSGKSFRPAAPSFIGQKADGFGLAPLETARLRVAHAAGERDGLGEIQADFAGACASEPKVMGTPFWKAIWSRSRPG